MNETEGYYIAITVIFGLFVLLVFFFLYKSVRQVQENQITLKNKNIDQLNDEELKIIKNYCKVIRTKKKRSKSGK